MDRRSFIKSMFAAVLLPFLPRGLSFGKECQEVCLQRSPVAGFQYYDGEKVWQSLKAGDLLDLSREPDNPHDNQAVEVLWRGHKLGYVPRHENGTLTMLLKHDAPLRARISNLDEARNSWKRTEFDVYLLVNDVN